MIVFFGGSFDPIHAGHLKMLDIVFAELTVSKVVLLPAPNTLFKKKLCASSKDRLKMIKLALKNYPYKGKIVVSDFEIKNKTAGNSTYLSLKKILKENEYINKSAGFILGSDQLVTLDQWKNIDKLSRMVQLIVIIRPNYILDNKVIDKYNIKVLKEISTDVSSTQVRAGNSSLPIIDDYIFQHQLYMEQRVKTFLTLNRYHHSLAVANLAKTYASKNLKKDAYIAGLLHDIAKDLPLEKQLSLIKKYMPQHAKTIPAFYHQICGAFLAKKYFNVNEKIMRAISVHTSGNVKMNKLDKIIYAADKTCDGREDQLIAISDLLIRDFDRGFKKLMQVLKKMFGANDDALTNAMYTKFS